jgi:uncharacterized repeat protein (TIGR01451 family)
VRNAAGVRLAAGAVLGIVGLVATATPAAAAQPLVGVSMTATIGSRDVSNQPYFSQQIVQYNDLVSNAGGASANAVVVTNVVPAAGAILLPGSVTCGSVPSCSWSYSRRTITFGLTSVAAGTGGLQMSFDVRIIQRRNVAAQAYWRGGGCRTACNSNELISPVIPSPLALSSSPPNRGHVDIGGSITYKATLYPYAYVAGDPGIVVTDHVPTGTNYVGGSASCGSTPGCSATASGGNVVFSLSAASFTGGSPPTMTFSTVNTLDGATITNRATWTGGECPSGITCRNQPYIGLNAGSPTSGGPAALTSPGAPAPGAPGALPPVAPGFHAGPGAGLTLSPSSISPGGSTVVSGVGCPADTPVVIAIDGKTVGHSRSDGRGRFSTRITPPSTLKVGPHRVTATCGPVTLSATLNVVVTTSTNSIPEGAAAAFAVFVLLGVILLRGQFDTNASSRRRRRGAADVLTPESA